MILRAIMTYNNAKIRNTALTVLFAFALLVPGAVMQSASASTGTAANVDSLINDMQDIQNEIAKLDPVNDAGAIQVLNDKFWMLNDLINTVTYVEPPRDFVDEWENLEIKQDTLESTLDTLENIGVPDAVTNVIDSQISQTDVDIENLRQESIASMVLDSAVETELENIQTKIHRDYPHIFDTYIDHEQQKVAVFVDYAVITNIQPTLDMLQKIGTDDVLVLDTPQIASCSGIKNACNPAVGGLAIVRPDETSSRGFSGSIGYKATDSRGNVGFVTAGHVADYSTYSSSASSNTIVNYYDGTRLGTVTEAYGSLSSARSDGKDHLDVAFVQTSKISDDIFNARNSVIDITDYATSKSDHQVGDFVILVGATSGKLHDRIYSYADLSNVVVFDTRGAKHGDSGGTVFKSRIDAGVRITTLLGHVTSPSYYVPVHLVESYYNITPQTR